MMLVMDLKDWLIEKICFHEAERKYYALGRNWTASGAHQARRDSYQDVLDQITKYGKD